MTWQTLKVLGRNAPVLQSILTACNGCGRELQQGEHLVCSDCQACLALATHYGVDIDWKARAARSNCKPKGDR